MLPQANKWKAERSSLREKLDRKTLRDLNKWEAKSSVFVYFRPAHVKIEGEFAVKELRDIARIQAKIEKSNYERHE